MSAVASDPLALDNVVAFALVLDSSPGLSAQWDRIFLSYVSPLLLRLFEAAGSYEKVGYSVIRCDYPQSHIKL